MSAKDIIVKPINSSDANKMCKVLHYSGKVVPNSQLHFGIFLNGKCEGVMQFGPSTFKGKMLGLVEGTTWNGFLELNRMAFSSKLPRNSESRAISVAHRLIKKHYPHIKWIISFADATQCGDGAIYRASGYVLTQIKKNASMLVNSKGEVFSSVTLTKGKNILKTGKAAIDRSEYKPLKGFQLRYIFFLDPTYREKLTVPEIPFSRISELGIGMYKGEAVNREQEENM